MPSSVTVEIGRAMTPRYRVHPESSMRLDDCVTRAARIYPGGLATVCRDRPQTRRLDTRLTDDERLPTRTGAADG